MLIHVLEQTVEDLTLTVQEQVLKCQLLLLVKQLVHDLVEVAAQDGQGLRVLVQERGHHV